MLRLSQSQLLLSPSVNTVSANTAEATAQPPNKRQDRERKFLQWGQRMGKDKWQGLQNTTKQRIQNGM
jgi:hypothetical protein